MRVLDLRVLLVVAALVIEARPADACRPVLVAPAVGRPTLAPPSAGTLAEDSVDITCTERACTIDATYRADVTAAAELAIAAWDVRDRTIVIDGAASEARIAPGRHVVQIVSTVAVREYRDDCMIAGIAARHPWLAQRPAPTHAVVLVQTQGSPRVKHPPSWSLQVSHVDHTPERPDIGPATMLWFVMPPDRFVHGGPLLLAGISSGPGDVFRLRGGWEAAIGRPWLVFALAVDTDASSLWRIAATADVTSRAWVLPLSSSAGGGAVIELGPERRAGVRGQVALALGPVRLTLSTDVLVSAGASVDAAVALLLGASG